MCMQLGQKMRNLIRILNDAQKVMEGNNQVSQVFCVFVYRVVVVVVVVVVVAVAVVVVDDEGDDDDNPRITP